MLSRIAFARLLPRQTAAAASCRMGFATDDSNKTGSVKEAVGKGMEKLGEAFTDEGSVGKQFTPEGSVGGTARKLGGPFHEEGAIGKQFTSEGAVGGTVESAAETEADFGKKLKHEARADEKMDNAREQIDRGVETAASKAGINRP